MRNPIPRPNPIPTPPVLAHALHAHVPKPKLGSPFPLQRHDAGQGLGVPHQPGAAALLGRRVVGEHFAAHDFDARFGVDAGEAEFFDLDEFRVGDAGFGGEEVPREDFAGVGAGEVAGFGDRVEDLGLGCVMHGEVVDGFVGGGGDAFEEWGLGKQAEYGFGVGGCESFSLGEIF